MKLNNRGFAISTMMYMILILALSIIACVLAILSTRSKILNKLKNDVQKEINDTDTTANYICIGKNETIELGNKYICKVSNTEKYTFYVTEVRDDAVDFIMGEKITFNKGNYGASNDVVTESKVAYVKNSDYNGGDYLPITALKVLKRITDNWFYLDTRTDTVDNIDYTGYKARLVAFRDISDLVNGSDIEATYVSNTITSTIYNDNKIYSINNKKVITDKTVNDEYEIVPLITVSKTKIKG